MWVLLLLWPVWLLGGSWADEVFHSMTLEEKIGQLFMIPACPKRGEDHWDDWTRLMEEFHIGNAIVKQGDPPSQVDFLNRLQAKAQVPLLVGGDTEWGLAMRMEETIAFPRQMTLGAVADLGAIYEMGKEVGREAKLVGIHICFAPVADVNNNPENPIIHMRSFGEDPKEVAARVSAYARGLADSGVMACAKHFPGHGDTSIDSHLSLPAINQCRCRLETVEFVPFRQALQEGIGAVMSAHLLVPSLDPVYPASLSRPILTEILREEWGFQGLIISDGLNMKGIADLFSPEEIAILSRKAGTDLLLFGDHINPKVDFLMREQIPRACRALKKAYLSGELDLPSLDASVLRILQAKEALGLHQAAPLEKKEVSSPEALELKKRLFKEAVTQIGKEPILQEGAAYLNIGKEDAMGQNFTHRFDVPLNLDAIQRASLEIKLQSFGQVVIAIHQANLLKEKFGFSHELLELVHSLSHKSILCLFATPYALQVFQNIDSILVAYENDRDAQEAAYQILKWGEPPRGRLPVLRYLMESRD